MKIKMLAALLVVLILIFAGCSVEIRNPEEPEPENISEPEEPSGTEEIPEPEETPSEPETSKKIDTHKFMTFEEITALGYYPIWMQPHTYVVYDEHGVPEIIEGGLLSEEDVAGREDIEVIGYIDQTDVMEIGPNTKVEYDLHGFMQNIYYLWPDGNYNLSPPFNKIEKAEITYYEDIANFGQENGVTVNLDNFQYHVFTFASKMNVAAESTSEPMDFPRYQITFAYEGEKHCINVDSRNIFTSTLLDGGNYISTLEKDYFSEAEKLFKEAE